MFDQAHPFMDLVWNRAPWTRVRLADIADAIRLVEGLPGGARLTDRFARADEHSGAIFELDLAATVLRRGLEVQLEPATRADKKCDLSAAESGQQRAHTVFVEVQVIQEFGDDTKRAMDVAEKLAPRLAGAMARRELFGQIYRIPEDEELGSLVPITTEFWKQCDESDEPHHLVLDDVMDVWAVPYGHPSREHLLSSGVPESFRSPAPDDPLKRTVRAIRLKIGQLPTLAPGVIVMRPPRLLLPRPDYLPYIVSTVKNAISDAPQISAVAIVDWAYAASATPKEARVPVAGALLIHHPDRHIFVREVVLIENPTRAYPAADPVIRRLF